MLRHPDQITRDRETPESLELPQIRLSCRCLPMLDGVCLNCPKCLTVCIVSINLACVAGLVRSCLERYVFTALHSNGRPLESVCSSVAAVLSLMPLFTSNTNRPAGERQVLCPTLAENAGTHISELATDYILAQENDIRDMEACTRPLSWGSLV